MTNFLKIYHENEEGRDFVLSDLHGCYSLIIVMILILFLGLIRMARFLWGIKKKLTDHINDPKAHENIK